VRRDLAGFMSSPWARSALALQHRIVAAAHQRQHVLRTGCASARPRCLVPDQEIVKRDFRDLASSLKSFDTPGIRGQEPEITQFRNIRLLMESATGTIPMFLSDRGRGRLEPVP